LILKGFHTNLNAFKINDDCVVVHLLDIIIERTQANIFNDRLHMAHDVLPIHFVIEKINLMEINLFEEGKGWFVIRNETVPLDSVNVFCFDHTTIFFFQIPCSTLGTFSDSFYVLYSITEKIERLSGLEIAFWKEVTLPIIVRNETAKHVRSSFIFLFYWTIYNSLPKIQESKCSFWNCWWNEIMQSIYISLYRKRNILSISIIF